jgi:hypothetical protein
MSFLAAIGNNRMNMGHGRFTSTQDAALRSYY